MKVHANNPVPAVSGTLVENNGDPPKNPPHGDSPKDISGSFARGEQLVKIAGLLAVFGYMELRAHLNYLGISSTTPLGVERYLAEFYSMATDLVFRAQVLSSLILPIILAAALVFILLRASDRTGKAWQKVDILVRWIRAHSSSPWTPALMLLFLIVFQLWFLSQLSGLVASGQVVGSLHPIDAGRRQGAKLFFGLFCVVLASGLIAWIPASANAKGATKWIWSTYRVVIAILGLVYLPNLYGAFIREASFPKISIKSDSAQKMCGLLVLQTDDMRIWTVSRQFGRIVVLKTSDAGPVVTGESQDLFALAEQAANGKPVDYCPK